MKVYFFSLLSLLTLVTACSKVPITGRKQLSLLPESNMLSMSLDSYSKFLKENKVINSGKDAEMVKGVGGKIANSVNTFLKQNKQANRVADFKWEFNLVESKEVNAWCMPGGKVAVYTGLMPVTQNESGLAVVMGHEIGHAVARHGNERMSQGLLQQLGGIGLAFALQNKPAETQNLFMQAYGAGSTIGVMLPFSRNQESEADKLGLVFMAMAGYDPNEAIAFWGRMEKKGGSAGVPEFMSTHPSHATRINDIKKFMPTAIKYYKKSGNYTPSTSNSSSGKRAKVNSKTNGTTKPVPNGGTNGTKNRQKVGGK